MSEGTAPTETRHEEHRAAMETARMTPAMHVPRHVRKPEVHAQVLGAGLVGRINTRIALAVTRAVGTMWAAYIFLLIALVSFPQAFDAFVHGNTLIGINWLSQSFLQLVLLPIIIVGQNVQAAETEARAEADHETLTAIHTLVRAVHAINEQHNTILDLLEQRTEALEPPPVRPVS
jgi:hypothetical protein